jgi:hypothetical protein
MSKRKFAQFDWLLPSTTNSIDVLAQSNLASVRLRAALSVVAGRRAGITIGTCRDNLPSKTTTHLLVGQIENQTDPTRVQRWLSYIMTAKEQGCKVVIDYTDHHLSIPGDRADFYMQALPMVDSVITSSSLLARSLASWHSGEITVIEDPVEVDIMAPRAKSDSRKTGLWFGHATNLPYLLDYLLHRFTFRGPLRLIVMSNLHPLPDNIVHVLQKTPRLANLEINAIPWSLDSMQAAAGFADFCLLPAGVNDPKKQGASANRLLSALALGLPTVADVLDSYDPFRPYFTNLSSPDIDRFFETPETEFHRVRDAQRSIISRYTLAALGEEWVSWLEKQT